MCLNLRQTWQAYDLSQINQNDLRTYTRNARIKVLFFSAEFQPGSHLPTMKGKSVE